MKIVANLMDRFGEMGYVINPDDVHIREDGKYPLLAELGSDKVVGTARVFRRGGKIKCEAEITDKDLIEKLQKGFLAIGAGCVADKIEKKGGKYVAHKPELAEVSLTRKSKKEG